MAQLPMSFDKQKILSLAPQLPVNDQKHAPLYPTTFHKLELPGVNNYHQQQMKVTQIQVNLPHMMQNYKSPAMNNLELNILKSKVNQDAEKLKAYRLPQMAGVNSNRAKR